MPTYEFRCPKGHDFEKFFKTMSTAPSELPCPECGALASRQLSGGAGFAFKGSGFYLTDYGKNAHRGDGPKADKTADSKSDKPAESKTDKPAEKKADTKAESPKPKAPSPKPKSE